MAGATTAGSYNKLVTGGRLSHVVGLRRGWTACSLIGEGSTSWFICSTGLEANNRRTFAPTWVVYTQSHNPKMMQVLQQICKKQTLLPTNGALTAPQQGLAAMNDQKDWTFSDGRREDRRVQSFRVTHAHATGTQIFLTHLDEDFS